MKYLFLVGIFMMSILIISGCEEKLHDDGTEGKVSNIKNY